MKRVKKQKPAITDNMIRGEVTVDNPMFSRDHPANKTPLFHERMAELRSRVSGNIAGVVVHERKKA